MLFYRKILISEVTLVFIDAFVDMSVGFSVIG